MPNEHVPSFKDTDNEKDAVMNSSAKLSSAEIAEDMERAFDVQMETMIATHRIENGGNNGLIMRFSPQDIQLYLQEKISLITVYSF